MNYDAIIVGTGFAGSVVAYKLAKAGKRILMFERRNHIAGNMYDYIDENGILIQKYGPHSFHTNDEKAFEFINEIGEWKEYILKARVNIDGVVTPSPFNNKTIDDFFDEENAKKIKDRLKEVYPEKNKVTIVELLESEDELIKEYANFLFEKDYRPYTAKQWGIKPEELDISILKRVPVRLDYTDAYFDDKYQVIPSKSFTTIFENMLSSPLIDIKIQTDACDYIKLGENGKIYFDGQELTIPIIYTGAIDELFDLKYGKLPYRSLYFDIQIHNIDSYQETPGVAHPMVEGYTRIMEYKKLPPQEHIKGITKIAVEYPVTYGTAKGKEPYYPVITDESRKIYQKYLEESKKYKNLYLCGRLAEFKYYNMDNVIIKALEVAEDLLK